MFKEQVYEIVNQEKEAEIIVINTCGFIESAKQEAINTILEMAEYKQKNCKYLIVVRLPSTKIQRRTRKPNPRSRPIHTNNRLPTNLAKNPKNCRGDVPSSAITTGHLTIVGAHSVCPPSKNQP